MLGRLQKLPLLPSRTSWIAYSLPHFGRSDRGGNSEPYAASTAKYSMESALLLHAQSAKSRSSSVIPQTKIPALSLQRTEREAHAPCGSQMRTKGRGSPKRPAYARELPHSS